MRVFTLSSQQPAPWVALRSYSDNVQESGDWETIVEWSVETSSMTPEMRDSGLKVWCWDRGRRVTDSPGLLPLNWDIA